MSAPIAEADRIALNALVDGALGAAEAAALEARIAAEPALAAARDEIAAVRAALAGLPREAPSAGFLARIEALAAPESAPEPAPERAPEDGAVRRAARPSVPRWRPRLDGLSRIAATLLATALFASSATYFAVAPSRPSPVAELAAGHRRSLLAATPVDVASSDRHTVKPWLDARIGLSPPAPDLAAQGFPLVGGRVEVLGLQPVPVLVYRHNEHVISLVAVPGGSAASEPAARAEGGFNMLAWRGDGFDFTAVSDLEPGELGGFAAAYRAATAPGG